MAFRAQRDVICRTASKDVAAATVESMGGSLERTVAALSRMVERVAQTQQQLDRLEPPTALAPFAAEDAARRRTRVRLLRRSIRALEHGNDADAASAALSRLVAKGQAAEAAQGLVSCP